MRKVIVESPYGSPDPKIVERNVRYLKRALRDCLLRGETPYASHGLIAALGVLDDSVTAERSLGISAADDWRTVADAVVVYQDYGITSGMHHGIHAAKQLNKVVEYRNIGAAP